MSSSSASRRGSSCSGTEVKAVATRAAVNLKDSYAAVRDGELYLVQAHITPYSHGTHENHDAERPRKLLLHKREIRQAHRQDHRAGADPRSGPDVS